MTDVEFNNLACAIKSSYPTSKILADAPAMKFWYEMLRDIDYIVAQNAFEEFAATSVFPPTIADIRSLCTERCMPQIPNFDEAWNVVQKAISMYGAQEPQMAFAAMDDITLSVVKNLGWTSLCQDMNQIAARANFREAYEEKAKRIHLSALLPDFVAKEKALLREKYIPAVKTKEMPQLVRNAQEHDNRENITDDQHARRQNSLEKLRRILNS